MKKILILIKYFLPGEKSGGPLSTIRNLIDVYYDEFDLHIVCLNHDINSKETYDVKCNCWLHKSKYNIMYVKESFGKKEYFKLFSEFSCIYACGLYEKASRYLALYSKKNKKCRAIIAPMGTLSDGALGIKSLKKRLYFLYSKLFNIYKNIVWSVSSSYEKNDLGKIFKHPNKVVIAEDSVSFKTFTTPLRLKKEGKLKIVSLSRIAPIKNIDFSLKVLKEINDIEIDFDIYGFNEDVSYFNECCEIMKSLPDNIHASFKGSISHSEVGQILLEYDLFLLPTKGENFGHVIYEALNYGCIPIISDKTPWTFLNKIGVKALPLNKSLFVNAINEMNKMSCSDFLKLKQKCVDCALEKFNNFKLNSGYKELFNE